MKALSLTQPWATLVAIGAKSIETRSWSTNYRGRIAIHTAKGFPTWAKELAIQDPFRQRLYLGGFKTLADLPLGAIIAVGHLHHVGAISKQANGVVRVQGLKLPVEGIELEFGDYTPGRYGWVITNVYHLRQPLPCKGSLGLWNLPKDVEWQQWLEVAHAET